jgi:hypothetical protein
VKAASTLLALGFVFALQAAAAQTTNALASAAGSTAQTPTTVPNKVEPPNAPPQDRSQIMRMDGMSSQAWTTIAIRRPDSTAFHDAREHEPKLALCLIGRKP